MLTVSADESSLMSSYYAVNANIGLGFGVNTTFNNISVILWQSVLSVEETKIPGENHRPVTSH